MKNNTDIEEIYGKLKIINDNAKWYAVKTKARHEKKVARKCKDYNISYYLPLIKSVRKYKNRVITFTKPLFSSYIFCRCQPSERRKLFQIGSIAQFLEPTNQLQLVRELKQIYSIHHQGAKFVPHRFLKKGKRIRIIKGPFEGYEGKISRRKTKYKLVLNISLIKQAVAVEIDVKNIIILD